MSTPPLTRPPGADGKKPTTSQSNIVTRNGARKAKIQTRAMTSGSKPSMAVLAAKRKAQQSKKQNMDTVLRDQYQVAMESQASVRGSTAVSTHSLMLQHRCLWDENYPERPERLSTVLDRCNELGLIDECEVIEPRPVTKEELSKIHSTDLYELMVETQDNEDTQLLEDISSNFDALYIHPQTHAAALLSAGSAAQLAEGVWAGRWANGMCLCRPPGHHAMRAEPCGYCVYNNAGVAAMSALDRGASRVLIVDWDVHHGQATQQMFYNDPRVVYFSIHRYEHGSFWPNLRQSDYNYVGEGEGEGYNFNVPLNTTGMTDGDYLAIWHQLLLPMAMEYQPELVIVSAGYDAAIGCPEYSPQLVIISAGYDSALGDEKGEMCVSSACYGWLCALLQSVCPKVCVLLEGGYYLPSLGEGAAHTLRSLLQYAPPKLVEYTPPCDSICETILNCIYVHKKYWKCYQYQPSYSVADATPNVDDHNKIKHTVTTLWSGDETRPDRFETRNCYPVQDDATKERNLKKLNYLKSVTALPMRTTVGYTYDAAMLKHRDVCEPGHVECPERIMRIDERLRDFNILPRLTRIEGRQATDDEILTVHTEQHLNSLKRLSSLKLRQLHNEKEAYESVYFHPDSLESARMAAGCVLEAVKCVQSGVTSSVLCNVRPPGHHAAQTPHGFCLLNSAAMGAVAAAAADRRVLLVDWDVHHGNGTQQILYNNNKVLFISIHRYDNGSFFPNSSAANYDKVGEGEGVGYNINIPWNKRGMGDTEYLAAFTQIVLPVATQFKPDLVIVSAGFDACIGDPLGGCKVSPECFGQMTSLLRTLAGGRLVLCLEGGYNVTATAYAAVMCAKALLGDPVQHHYEGRTAPHPSAVETINNVINVHKKHWSCLRFQVALPIEENLAPQVPCRGLTDQSDADRILERVLQSVRKADSLEATLQRMSLKCTDGNCGSDDEQPGCSTAPKQTLASYLQENMDALANEEMFAVIPKSWCPHLTSMPPIPAGMHFRQNTKCRDCAETNENWVCLHCFVVACGRSVSGHMRSHHQRHGHALTLSLMDLSVWCYECDCYVDNERLYAAKNNAHINKFNEPMPWCYNSQQNTLQLQ